MEFIAGALVGLVIAGLIGRAKFLQVQTQLRAAKSYAEDVFERLVTERRLNDGLTETLDAISAKTRITGV